MKLIFFYMKFIMADIIPYKKSDASHNDQSHNGNVNQGIICICGKRGVRSLAGSHQIKACIAESGHRMENPKVNPPRETKFRDKPDHQEQGACHFNNRRPDKSFTHQAHYAAHLVGIHAFLQNTPCFQGYLFI